MNHLFGYEFRRLSRSVSFYICMILMGVFSVFTILTQRVVYSMVYDGFSDYVNGNSGLFDALAGSKLSLLLPIFLSIFVCGEYAEGTIKNVVGHGTSRTKLFFQRYLVCLAAVLIMTLFSMLCGWITGSICGGISFGYTGRFFLTLLLQILSALAYATMFYLIAVLIRKIGGSVLLGLFGPALVTVVLSIVDMLNDFPVNTADYTVSGAFDMVNSGTIVTEADMLQVLIVCLVHIGVFLVIGWQAAIRQEM